MNAFAYDIDYNEHNLPEKIYDSGDTEYKIYYGTDQQRKKTELSYSNNVVETKYYLGAYEKEITDEGTRELNYVPTPNGISAVYIQTANRAESSSSGAGNLPNKAESSSSGAEMYYIHTDYLGSIAAISKSDRTLVQDYYYTAWGKRQILNNRTGSTDFFLDRGYTGHQHLNIVTSNGSEMALINMNARLYDPQHGRMLSPDNYIQFPDFTQAYNRYSYAYNNPLKFTDPDGNNPIIAGIIVGTIAGCTAGAISSGTLAFWDWEANDIAIAIGVGVAAGVGTHFIATHTHTDFGGFIKDFKNRPKKGDTKSFLKHSLNDRFYWVKPRGTVDGRGSTLRDLYFFNSTPRSASASVGAPATLINRPINLDEFFNNDRGDLASNFGLYNNVTLDRVNATVGGRRMVPPNGRGAATYPGSFNGVAFANWDWRGNITVNLGDSYNLFFGMQSTPPGTTSVQNVSFQMRITATGSTSNSYPMVTLDGVSGHSGYQNKLYLRPWRPWGDWKNSCPPWRGGRIMWSKHIRTYYLHNNQSFGRFSLFND